jgi:DNA adenine methylase
MPREKQYASNAERQKAHRERKARALRNTSALQHDRQLVSINRPPLRWLGGKWKLASWIIERFPPHITYVEPFCGGGNVLLQKDPSEIEVLNDLNSDVINFFDVLRTGPEALIRAVHLTPFSREVHARSFAASADPIERALRFYVRCWQSFQPGSDGRNSGWRWQKTNNRGKSVVSDWTNVDHLWAVAERLKMVQLEHDDALTVIQRYDTPDTLFYVDPPYVIDTRSSSNPTLYKHEMNDNDHVRLANLLNSIQGMAILSGYTHPMYDELYKGWCSTTKTSTTNAGGQSLEVLWLSPKAVDVARLPLFAL